MSFQSPAATDKYAAAATTSFQRTHPRTNYLESSYGKTMYSRDRYTESRDIAAASAGAPAKFKFSQDGPVQQSVTKPTVTHTDKFDGLTSEKYKGWLGGA